jgi:hypothetical protein
VLFATAPNNAAFDSFYRVEHADGYLSLLPRQYIIPETQLSGPPAVLGKRNQLAVGGRFHVYLVGLDGKGMPAGEVIRTRVLANEVRALAYSNRFDRLFVGVDVSK